MIAFKPENILELPKDGPAKLRSDRDKTLILIKGSGEVAFANGRTEKDEIVRRFDDATDLLLLAWTGKWSTDIFRVTKADLDSRYR
jgi:hypothetical protein